MIPIIDNAIEQLEFATFPSFTYKLDTDANIIQSDIDGIEALKQAIFHRLLTERYAYVIYDDNYGTELEQYKSKGFGFLEATIENTLKDSLLQDDRINNIAVTGVAQTGLNSALIKFDVYSNIGIINISEVQINI